MNLQLCINISIRFPRHIGVCSEFSVKLGEWKGDKLCWHARCRVCAVHAHACGRRPHNVMDVNVDRV